MQPNTVVTKIVNGTIVAFDGHEHCLLENGVLVYTDDTITYVGKHYQGESDRTIDATGKLIIPGQISTHAHVGIQEGSRAILDNGKPEFSRAFFLNYLPTKLNSGSTYLGSIDSTASVRYGMASLIRHGVTTVINFAPGGVQAGLMMADLATEFGLRLYAAPIVTSGSYHFDNQGRLKQSWNEAAGLKALEGVVEFVEQLTPKQKQYVTPIVTVDEAFFITPELLQRARELASRLKLRLTLHAAEQLFEFHDAIRQQGKTPIGALADAGVLDTDVILAHCIYVSGHSATGYPFGQDLEILAQSGATIAHSPTVQARRGIALESFQRYLDVGVNVALATDSYPLDMIGEMRSAAQVGKVTDQRYNVARSQDIFNASNLAGARALGRSDLGRLSVGAKADIVLIDFDNLAIGPVYDPIRSLVHLASSEMVDTVIIDGRTLLENKQLLICSEQEILQSAKKFSQEYWSTAADRHWAGETVETQFPRSLKIWEETVNETQASA
ncbi:MAG: amidohydrolase family protein [Drouetiella hepatica Uher 2000/2452]|uniref:Amidohydrolase family protein n=1 Tax=Drouetiella hepatica Uher 2000/2452 TaxID=904376 RepID=A0A951URQ2_9CYAN|nr:amidohydrolase family protein [Drouetiella hepatica Uher 2000/2452]